MATDCRGNVYVADTFNDRIQKLGEPGNSKPPCAGGPGSDPTPPHPTPPHPTPPGSTPPGSTPPGSADTSPPDGDVKAKGSQTAGKAIKITVGSNEAATVIATGKVIAKGGSKARSLTALIAKKKKATFKLKKKEKEIAAGGIVTLKLKQQGKKAKRKLVKLVKGGAKAKAKITVTLTDLAGNSTSERLVVKLKK